MSGFFFSSFFFLPFFISLLSAFCNLFFYKLKIWVGLAFMSLKCEKRAFLFLFLFLFSDEKAILYNILLPFGGPFTSGGLRRWPKWPISSASTSYTYILLFFKQNYLFSQSTFSLSSSIFFLMFILLLQTT